jgi:indole-3-glycerol phosphate synthase
MRNVLDEILQYKKQWVAQRKALIPLAQLQTKLATAPLVRDFEGALRHQIVAEKPAIIAEIKKASPSRGILREDFEPAQIAQQYQKAGAACLSVLTDEKFFQGRDEDLRAARDACQLPVLRKDFIVDDYQIYESRVLGADCILLIVAALSDVQLRAWSALASSLNMSVLVEVHDQNELERALSATRTPLIGINNRNLRTFETSLNTTLDLRSLVPDSRLLITESGVNRSEDVAQLWGAGVKAFLVGEALVRCPDPGEALRQLLGFNSF